MSMPQLMSTDNNSNLLNEHPLDDGVAEVTTATANVGAGIGSKMAATRRAYRAAHRVETDVVRHSHVLDAKRVNDMVRLHSNEVLLGNVLGSGTFCHVTAVRGVDFKSTRCNNNHNTGGDGVSVPSPTRNRRQEQRQLIRDGSWKGQYAIKSLRGDLSPDKFQEGAAELVVEMLFLASLDHGNIIKLHGVSNDGPKGLENGSGFFILIDRLCNTLDQQLILWRKLKEGVNYSMRRYEPNAPPVDVVVAAASHASQVSLLERLTVAADISSALVYLHSKNILYRGIDPTNLAFNHAGKIVLFDFGLARELEDAKVTSNGIHYELSGNRGSLSYMAPEVGTCQPYGLKADVYGMAMLLWQLCTLAPTPFPDLTNRSQYLERIVHNKERPTIETSWSDTLQYLIQSSWADEPSLRPPMKQFHRNLQHEILDIQACIHQTMFRHRQSKPGTDSAVLSPNPLLSGLQPQTMSPGCSNWLTPPPSPLVSNRQLRAASGRSSKDNYLAQSIRRGSETAIVSAAVGNHHRHGRMNVTMNVKNTTNHDLQMATLHSLRKANKMLESSNPSPGVRSETSRLQEGSVEYKRRLVAAAFRTIATSEPEPIKSFSLSQDSSAGLSSAEHEHTITIKGQRIQRRELSQDTSISPSINRHSVSKSSVVLMDTGQVNHSGDLRDYPNPATSSSKNPTLVGKGNPHLTSPTNGRQGSERRFRLFPSYNIKTGTKKTSPAQRSGDGLLPILHSSWSGGDDYHKRSALVSHQPNRSKSMRGISWKDQVISNNNTTKD